MRQAKTGIKDISRKRDRQRDRTGGRNIDRQTKAGNNNSNKQLDREERDSKRGTHERC